MSLTNLDIVTATIVYEMEHVGVFHYCKLTYLFEYFFIKNFGTRYTKEHFIKLPHGPVISNYKRQISKLYDHNILQVDVDEFNRVKGLDDYNETVTISPATESANYLIPERMAYALLLQVLREYGSLTVRELEEVVYKTSPVIKYCHGVEEGFKPRTGGYVLKGDCIRMKDHKNCKTKGREIALKHLRKYPTVNFETQKELVKELKDLEQMRPKP